MQQMIVMIHVLVAIAIIVLVLLQHGKGADIGATFGSGSSNTMFGSVGSMPFFVKLTGVLAAVFFASSLALSYFSMPHRSANMDGGVIPSSQTVPVPMNMPMPGSVPTVPQSTK